MDDLYCCVCECFVRSNVQIGFATINASNGSVVTLSQFAETSSSFSTLRYELGWSVWGSAALWEGDQRSANRRLT